MRPLFLFLLTFTLAALFAFRTPQWQAPDEPAHYAYVATIAQTGQPPILVPACYNEQYKNALVSANFSQPIDFSRFCYEGHQPPFFYYLAAPVFIISNGSLLSLRLLCALIGAFVPVIAYLITRTAGGDRGLAFAVGGLVALVPQHLAMIGTLNNDALTFLSVALALWQMVRLLQRGDQPVPRREWVVLGLLVGLALITKTLAWITLPLAALTLLLRTRPRVWRPSLQQGATVATLAALFILPWFARNALTYGAWDIMGLQRHNAITIGQPRTAEQVAQRGAWGTFTNGVETTFHSFWGQFGWMKAPLQAGEYQILGAFHLLAGVGLLVWLARRGWRGDGINGRVVLLFAVWILLNLSLLLYYNLEFVQYQGRYLFSALTPIAFFLMVGLCVGLKGYRGFLTWGPFLLYLLYLDYLAISERLPGMLNY